MTTMVGWTCSSESTPQAIACRSQHRPRHWTERMTLTCAAELGDPLGTWKHVPGPERIGELAGADRPSLPQSAASPAPD